MKKNNQLSVIIFSCDWFYEKDGRIWSSPIASSSIRLFGDNFSKVGIAARLSPQLPDTTKHIPFPENYSLHPIPFETGLKGRIKQQFSVFRIARSLIRLYDVPFVRMFSLEALAAAIYCTFFFRKPWFMTLHGDTAEAISISWQWKNKHRFLRKPICGLFRWLTRVVCKKPAILYTAGPVLKDIYAPKHPESMPFIDTGIRKEDIYEERLDICTSESYELLFVGNTSPRKGLDILLKVVVKLRELQVPVKLTILGGGTKNDLANLCEDFDKITDIVQFGGYFTYGKPLFERMRKSDILVVPSRGAEGWNRVITECNAQGVPAVVTDVNSLAASVSEMSTGIVVPPEDADALVAAIRKIVDNPEERRAMVKRNLERGRNYIYANEFLRIRKPLEKIFSNGLLPVEQISTEEAGR